MSDASKEPTDQNLADELRGKLRECCRIMDTLRNREYTVDVTFKGGVDGEVSKVGVIVSKVGYL